MVTIVAGTHSHGQGHATVYAQMVSEWLGVPFGNIRFVQGDTNAVPIGRGTYGSRSMQVGGNALKKAADAIVDKAKPMAAHLMEASAGDIEFKDGRFSIVGTDRSMALTDVAKAFYRPAHLPPQFEVGLEAAGSFSSEPPNYPNGCHVCEVEVDPDSGAVAVVRYHAVDDVGRVMNHLLCEGQVHGGVAQGVGQALMEAVALRRQRPARDRQLPGLLHAARRRPARDRVGAHRNSVDHQSARREGCGRGRRDRRAAGGDRRDPRCAAAARRRAYRHAGDAEPGLGGDPARAGEWRSSI